MTLSPSLHASLHPFFPLLFIHHLLKTFWVFPTKFLISNSAHEPEPGRVAPALRQLAVLSLVLQG